MEFGPPSSAGNPISFTSTPTALITTVPIPMRPTNNDESTSTPFAPIPVRSDDREYCKNACVDEIKCRERCAEISLEWGWSADEQSDFYLPYAGCFTVGNKCYFGNFEGGEYEFDEIFEVGRKSRLCCDNIFD
jgi:hypothetical protein